MFRYYSDRLAGERLKLCYDLAPRAVQRYLEAEIEHVQAAVRPGDRVLELGCGYGRVLAKLGPSPALLAGIDVSLASLRMADKYLRGTPGVALAAMDAVALALAPASFDLVCCVQNGISAFHADQGALLCSAVAVTRPGGRVMFFSYAEEFWEQRLAWFRIQAAHGLVGEIDEAATRDGTIVCRDGFTATTVSPSHFAELSAGLGRSVSIRTLAGASVLCEITA